MYLEMTTDDLADRVLGHELVSTFEAVDLERTALDMGLDTSTVEELARRYLAPKVNQAFPKVDLKVEEFELGVAMEGLHLYMHGRGLAILLVLLILGSLLVGTGPFLQLLRSLLGG